MSLYERLGRFMCRRSYTTYRAWFYLVVVPRLAWLMATGAALAVRHSLTEQWRDVVARLPHTREDWKDMRGDGP